MLREIIESEDSHYDLELGVLGGKLYHKTMKDSGDGLKWSFISLLGDEVLAQVTSTSSSNVWIGVIT